LWYRAAERTWAIVRDSTPYAKEVGDLPIGLIPGTPYTQTAIQLSAGDLLVLYTDGITESRNSADVELGCDELCRLAAGVPVTSADGAGLALLAEVERFRGTVPAMDDETVLVIRRDAVPPRGFAA
jgi:serine phosphatase RsbU (regulator of sigma subunit)